MIRVLHAADLHLGSTFKGLPDGAAWPAATARATLRAFTRLVDLALSEKVDALLLAGDVFDERDRPLDAHLHLFDELSRVSAAGIPTFVVHGNHDPLGPGQRWPAGVTVFGPQWSEHQVLGPHGELRFRVQGMSYPAREVRENLALRFKRQGSEPTIGLLHANLSDWPGHANYAPCTAADLDRAQLDYWALGHVHTRGEVALPHGALAAYPGNLQGRHHQELGPRGALLVELDAQASPRARTTFVPLGVVQWERLEVSIDGLEGPEELAPRATAALDALPPFDGFRAVRVALTGAGPVHHQLERADAVEALEASLREVLLRRQAALERVDDGTRPQLDLDRLVASGGYTGELARLLLKPGNGEWVKREALEPLQVALGRAQLEPLELSALLEPALKVALDALLEDGAP